MWKVNGKLNIDNKSGFLYLFFQYGKSETSTSLTNAYTLLEIMFIAFVL